MRHQRNIDKSIFGRIPTVYYIRQVFGPGMGPINLGSYNNNIHVCCSTRHFITY